jgi:hypothetical protein
MKFVPCGSANSSDPLPDRQMLCQELFPLTFVSDHRTPRSSQDSCHHFATILGGTRRYWIARDSTKRSGFRNGTARNGTGNNGLSRLLAVYETAALPRAALVCCLLSAVARGDPAEHRQGAGMSVRRHGKAQAIPRLPSRSQQSVFSDTDVSTGAGDKITESYSATLPSRIWSVTFGFERRTVRLVALYGPSIPDLPA